MSINNEREEILKDKKLLKSFRKGLNDTKAGRYTIIDSKEIKIKNKPRNKGKKEN